MADIEKVKQGLDRCKHGDGKYCFVCQYAKENKKPFPPICNKELCNDALSVIEELQAEIERLKKNIKMKNTRLKLMKADKEYWRNLWLANLEENDD